MNLEYIEYVCTIMMRAIVVLYLIAAIFWLLRKRNFLCLLGDHEWTCAANEGIEPTPEQRGSWQGFKDYARMYCKHCGKMSKLNDRLL